MTSTPRDPATRPAVVERALDVVRGRKHVDFGDLALEIFAFQYERNAPYRRLCDRRGAAPGSVRSWEEIPPVPVEAFRRADLWCAPPAVVFLTSGTTGGQARGRHGLPETALYEAAWEPPFRRHVLPDRSTMPILSLVPDGREAPESSLSFMTDRILRRFGAPGSGVFLDASGIRHTALCGALDEAAAAGRPVLLLGTAFAFAYVMEAMAVERRTVRLPAGSRIMDTGGFKGRGREVPRDELLAAFEERLGVPASRVVGEYGMTELSSQFYERTVSDPPPAGADAGSGRQYVGPAWTRTRVLDPETLRPLPDGEVGLLAHMDLANAWTVTAIVTGDLGVMTPRGFLLRGRARGAELRGCSLAAEELLDGGR